MANSQDSYDPQDLNDARMVFSYTNNEKDFTWDFLKEQLESQDPNEAHIGYLATQTIQNISETSITWVLDK